MKKDLLMILGVAMLAVSAFPRDLANQEMALTTFSEEARAFFLEARDRYERLDFSAARQLLDKAIAMDKKFALAYAYRSMLGGDVSLQRADIIRAQAMAENVSEGERILIDYIQALLNSNQSQQQESLHKLLTLCPDDIRVKMFAGQEEMGLGEYQKAIEYYTQIVDIDERYAPVYNLLGYAQGAAGNLRASELAFRRYIRLVPDEPTPYYSFGEFLFKLGNYNESITQYQKAYDLDHQFVGALAGIGHNYQFQGKFTKAREYYNLYFALSSEIGGKLNALYYTALSYMCENKAEDAVKGFIEWGILAQQARQPMISIYSYILASSALIEMGQPAAGLKKFEEAVPLVDQINLPEPERENLRTLLNIELAYGYAANNRLHEAKTYANRYKREIKRHHNPDEESNLHMVLAYIDFKAGKYKRAITLFSRLTPNPWILYHQAQAYLKIGDSDCAEELIRQIIDWNQNTFWLAAVWPRIQRMQDPRQLQISQN